MASEINVDKRATHGRHSGAGGDCSLGAAQGIALAVVIGTLLWVLIGYVTFG